MQGHSAGITQRIQIALQHQIPLQGCDLTADLCHLLTLSELLPPSGWHLIQLLLDPFKRVKLC